MQEIMKRTDLVRLGGLAAMVGGVVYVGLVLLTDPYWLEQLYYVNTIGYGFVAILQPLGAMAAISALHALQGRRYGMTGAYFPIVAFVGLALAVGALTVEVIALSYESHLLFFLILIGLLVASVGIAALGVQTMAAGVLPWWCGVALIAGNPFGMFLMMTPSQRFGDSPKEVLWLMGAFEALGGVAWVLVGYAVFRAAGRVSERPSRVR